MAARGTWSAPALRAGLVAAFVLPVAWSLGARVPGQVEQPWTSGLLDSQLLPEFLSLVPGSTVRRVDLLAYVWQLSSSPLWIWVALAAAAAMMFAGTGLVGSPSAGRAALGCANLALALGVLYAALVPPFQAPDEPDHLLSYARVTGLAKLAHRAEQLARLGHLERIKFNPLERFRPKDVGRPYVSAWGPHVRAEAVETRSPLTLWIWRGIGLLPARARAPAVILEIRLANAALFAAAVGAAALLFARLAPGLPPPPLLLFLALVPALPFFATHVGESATLAIAYVLFAACVLGLFLDGPRSHLLGPLLGVATAVMLAAGRASVALLPVLAACAAGRLALGSRSDAGGRRAGALFWVGLGCGGLLALAVLHLNRRGLSTGDVGQPIAVSPFVDGALRHGVWLVPVLCLLGALAEAALQPVRRRFGESQPLRGAIRLGGFGMAGVVAACPLIAAACSVRPLGMFVVEGPFATAPPTPGRYAAEVLGAMAASVRLSDHEHLMVNSFWTGFGWLDVITLSALAASLHTLSWLALVGLAWRLAASGDARRVLWLGVIGLGLLVSLVVYSQATLSLMRNLHGRYLLGWYLVALSLAWSWLPSAPARSRLVVGFAAATAAAAHSWSLCAVLARYF